MLQGTADNFMPKNSDFVIACEHKINNRYSQNLQDGAVLQRRNHSSSHFIFICVCCFCVFRPQSSIMQERNRECYDRIYALAFLVGEEMLFP